MNNIKKLLIFGNGSMAEIANYYFSHAGFATSAFIADQGQIKDYSFCSRPLITLGEAERKYVPNEHFFFVAIGYKSYNEVRAEKCELVKSKGYTLVSYIHQTAKIAKNAAIGEHAFILEDNIIQPFATIGNNNFFWSGNHIGHSSNIGSNNFFSSHVVICGNVSIHNNSFFGANATLRDGISIGNKCMVGAGALVMHDLPALSVCAPHGTPVKNFTTDDLPI